MKFEPEYLLFIPLVLVLVMVSQLEVDSPSTDIKPVVEQIKARNLNITYLEHPKGRGIIEFNDTPIVGIEFFTINNTIYYYPVGLNWSEMNRTWINYSIQICMASNGQYEQYENYAECSNLKKSPTFFSCYKGNCSGQRSSGGGGSS